MVSEFRNAHAIFLSAGRTREANPVKWIKLRGLIFRQAAWIIASHYCGTIEPSIAAARFSLTEPSRVFSNAKNHRGWRPQKFARAHTCRRSRTTPFEPLAREYTGHVASRSFCSLLSDDDAQQRWRQPTIQADATQPYLTCRAHSLRARKVRPAGYCAGMENSPGRLGSAGNRDSKRTGRSAGERVGERPRHASPDTILAR